MRFRQLSKFRPVSVITLKATPQQETALISFLPERYTRDLPISEDQRIRRSGILPAIWVLKACDLAFGQENGLTMDVVLAMSLAIVDGERQESYPSMAAVEKYKIRLSL